MTNDPHDRVRHKDASPDLAVDALLRRADRAHLPPGFAELEARIVAQAAFPLASRRRNSRISTAEMLAGWVRVALPLAAAAALFAALSMSSIESTSTLADAELRDSDPAALLSALESDGGSGLAHHVIASDGETSASESDSR
jgi:hypothetical protein